MGGNGPISVRKSLLTSQVCTGRQVSTPAAHLQAVSCVAATQFDLTTGSEDSNIHVWSIPRLLSLTSNETHEPLRTLSNHRAAITSLVMGQARGRAELTGGERSVKDLPCDNSKQ